MLDAGAGIRTLVDLRQQVLSLSPLASRAPPLIKKKGYKKNKYKYEEATVHTVEENWGMALEKWNYSL